MNMSLRQERMRLLALAPETCLDEALSGISLPGYRIVRGPETGLVMARGRVGNVEMCIRDSFFYVRRLRQVDGTMTGRMPMVWLFWGRLLRSSSGRRRLAGEGAWEKV